MRTISENLTGWFEQSARDLPWRRTKDPYGIWISEIMLQQTQVVKVYDYWIRWMQKFPSIGLLAQADIQDVLKLWEGLGYYRRCRNIHKAAQQIVSEFNGIFPNEHEKILSLPGIGPYTAGAIASIAFNLPEPIVDGNVERVFSRLFTIKGDTSLSSTKKQMWSLASELISASAKTTNYGDLNQALMELGALICLPTNPKCLLCPVHEYCGAKKENIQTELPNKPKNQKAVSLSSSVWIFKNRDEYLMRKLSSDDWNAGYYAFPSIEESDGFSPPESLWGHLPIRVTNKNWVYIGEVKHAITNHRIKMMIYFNEMTENMRSSIIDHDWFTMSKIKELPVSGSHLKILKLLEKHLKIR